MPYLNVKGYVKNVRDSLKKEVETLGNKPKLTIFCTLHSAATDSYMRNKVKVAQEVGIEAEVVDLSDKSLDEIRTALWRTSNPSILQLPLREDLRPHEDELIGLLDVWDADGLGTKTERTPATALGIAEYIKQLVKDKVIVPNCKIVIVNRSKLIGRPLIDLLLKQDFCVSVLHSKVNAITKFRELVDAEVVVTATGIPNFINPWDIGTHAVVIDAGIARDENGKLCGDVSKECSEVNQVTPVPGGVGQLTTTYLMHNVLEYYRKP